MNKKIIPLCLALILSACSSEDSDNESTTPEIEQPQPETYAYSVNATFFKGFVSNSTCTINKIEEGQKGEELKTGETNENGVVNFSEINYFGSALIECVGGRYIDEATEREVNNRVNQVRTVVGLRGDQSQTIETVLTPLTEISLRLAELNETPFQDSQVNYNQKISTAFGLGEIDITTVVPLDVLNVVVSEGSPEASYAFAVSLLTGVVQNQNETRNIEDVINDFAIDLNQNNLEFSEIARTQLGESAQFFLNFGSLLNSSLQATRVRQDLIESANLILPDSGEIVTDSVREPIEQIRTELVEYVLNNNLEKLPEAPFVSDEMYTLGQALAFDKILSGNRDTSCLSCHHPLLATGDNRSLPLGTGGKNLGQDRVGGHLVPRHAPALFNLDLFKKMFWDGRVEFNEEGKLETPATASGDMTEEMEAVFFANQETEGFQGYGLVSAQAMFPVTSHEEMKGDPLEGNELAQYEGSDFKEIWSALMLRLGAIPEYVSLFESAYPNVKFEDMTFAHAANAIAGFEIRAFDFRESPWQSVVTDIAADGIWDSQELLDEDTTRGAHFFFETGCNNCHSGSVMSNFDFHSIATAQFGHGKGDGASGYEDFGRERVTGNPNDRTKFRTAPLLNVALTAPYGHLGQFKELASHIQIYAQPERFWLNLYTGYDRVREDFVHTPTFETEITENEKALLKEIPLPSYDGEKHGFIKTTDYIEEKLLSVTTDPQRLTDETGKRFGDNEIGLQRRILIQFMQAQTDPRARRIERVIPDTVPSGLPVEKTLIEE